MTLSRCLMQKLAETATKTPKEIKIKSVRLVCCSALGGNAAVAALDRGRATRTPISLTPVVVRVFPDSGRAMGTVWDLAGRMGVPS